MVEIWWVNQSTRKGAADNEIVWAPETDSAGRTPWHWSTMGRVQAGDLIYHYTDGYVVGSSIATDTAIPSGNPYPSGSSTWNTIGRRIPIDYLSLEVPIARDDIPIEVRQSGDSKSSPFDRRGWVAQGYLFPVGPELWRELAKLTGFGDVVANVDTSHLLDLDGPTDVVGEAIRRREQRELKRKLLGGRDAAECGVCSLLTPRDYLVAGHIKRRSKATEAERRDTNIVMLVCVFGCDKAFELGDVRVGQEGLIAVSQRLSEARPEYAENLRGTTAPGFSAASSVYFGERLRSFKDQWANS